MHGYFIKLFGKYCPIYDSLIKSWFRLQFLEWFIQNFTGLLIAVDSLIKSQEFVSEYDLETDNKQKKKKGAYISLVRVQNFVIMLSKKN